MIRVALVTGAGRGIGREAAMRLAASGWTVVFSGRNAETLAEAVSAAAGRQRGLVADVRSEDSVTELFSRVEDEFGRLDLLFNNAGLFPPAERLDRVKLADWQEAIDVNLTGSFLCARAAFDLMLRQSPPGGRIINNGSISAHVPRPNMAAYSASKHAITGLTRSISLEGRDHGIVCSQIDVGNAATSMMTDAPVGLRQADGSLAPEPTMDVRHVADMVAHIADLPLSANVQFVTLIPPAMPYIGRG